MAFSDSLLNRIRSQVFLEHKSGLVKSAQLLFALVIARVTLFLAFVLLLRKMGPAQFGTFFLGYSTLAFVPLIADMGIGQTFVRHISFYRTSRPQFAAYLHRLFFILKSVSVAIVLLVAMPVVPLAARFLNLQSQQLLMAVAIMGSGAVILSEYANAVFQSQCLFRRYELYLFLRNTLFLAAVPALATWHRAFLAPAPLILAIVLINLALAASAYPYISRLWHGAIGKFSEFRSNLIRYSKWLTVSAICFALYRRMDIYFLSHFRSAHEVGIYSVAVVLVEPVAMMSPALATVFLPQISGQPTNSKLLWYIRLVAAVCSLVFIGICFYVTILRLLFRFLSPEYREALPVAVLLLCGTVLLIGYNMLSLVFLASDRPHLFGQIALAMAVCSLIANWFAVPAYGVMGAAAVYGLCQALGILLATLSIRKLLRAGTLVLHLESDSIPAAESVLT